MTASKYLIVNADDFGQSAGINRGIIQAHEGGIVTSASLMVRWPAAAAAAEYARAHRDLGVGLHLDFGEWSFRDGAWAALYEVVPAGDEKLVAKEVAAQIQTFRSLVGTDPTHIDSHQHTHLREPARSIVSDVANKLGVPLRSCTAEIAYIGDFYGQTAEGISLPEVINTGNFIEILRALPAGISEVGCHPGFAGDLDTMYGSERESEIDVLCDPRVTAAVAENHIELVTFADLPVLV